MVIRFAAPRSGGGHRAPGTRRAARHRRLLGLGVAGMLSAAVAVSLATVASSSAAAQTTSHASALATVSSTTGNFDGLGIPPGKIKHVWLIILENKSYDATFTGLNNNTYLWKTLPSAGCRC